MNRILEDKTIGKGSIEYLTNRKLVRFDRLSSRNISIDIVIF